MKKLGLFFISAALYAQGAIMNVTVNWQASPTTSTPITYKVYRAPGVCSSTSNFGTNAISSGITQLTFADNNLAIGTYCYKVSANGLVNGVMTESVGNPTITLTPAVISPPNGAISVTVVIPPNQ